MNYEIIEIAKNKYPIKFGFAALRNYSNITNTSLKDLDKIGVDMTLDNALHLMYCGIKDGHRIAKQEFLLSVDDIADMLDQDMGALERVFNVLSNQMSNQEMGNVKAKKVKKKN